MSIKKKKIRKSGSRRGIEEKKGQLFRLVEMKGRMQGSIDCATGGAFLKKGKRKGEKRKQRVPILEP